MVDEILGVVYEIPVPNEVPPVGAAYQFNVPVLAEAIKVTVPASHRAAGVVPVTVGVVLIVAVTVVLDELVQPLFDAST